MFINWFIKIYSINKKATRLYAKIKTNLNSYKKVYNRFCLKAEIILCIKQVICKKSKKKQNKFF